MQARLVYIITIVATRPDYDNCGAVTQILPDLGKP